MIDTPSTDQGSLDFLLGFNLPVCDLTTLKDEDIPKTMSSNCGKVRNCVGELIPQLCALVSLNGAPFPYQDPRDGHVIPL